ncbi:MAG: family 10 glycosylhydrolase [Thermostichales cyanobacterium BF4_bins_65]
MGHQQWGWGLAALLGLSGQMAWANPKVSITVLRDPDQPNWEQIQARLERMDLFYQVLPRQELTPAALRQVQVLFLPNLPSLSAAEVQTLQAWVQGSQGKLIVSGDLSRGIPEGVRPLFRELVGAYWLEPQSRTQAVVPRQTAGQQWTQTVVSRTPIQGGVLVPATLSSRVAATWGEGIANPVAVVTTPQTAYLGWHWGMGGPAQQDLDRQWLEAVVARFGLGWQPVATLERNLPPPQPLTMLEMSAMRLELSNLLGRVESAILTTDAIAQSPGALPPHYQALIAEAREVIRLLPEWVQTQQYNKARHAFEQVRAELWRHYPLDRLSALPEVRAIWLDRGTIVSAGSPQGLAKIFDRLAAAGINTVFFETVNAGYPIYPSRLAPQQNPLTRHWDPLRAAVQLAHERQIELHAWIWTFATGNSRHNLLPGMNLPESFPGPVLSLYPDWANTTPEGSLFPRGQRETWLDPANGTVRRYLLGLIQEIIRDYHVDGIHLDYIRYPFQDPGRRNLFGYGLAARQGFMRQAGVDPTQLDPHRDPQLWAAWTQFRVQQVNEFVAEVARYSRRWNPQIILSAAVYAMPTHERVQKIQQHWETWIANGDIDLLVPMTYVENTRRLEQLVKPNLEAVSQAPVLYIPSLNLLDLPKVEFLDKMQAIRDLPTSGYALFAARQLNDEFQGILAQSRIPSSQVPYRRPFAAVAARFRSLQQEWDFLLQHQQIWIQERERLAWQEETRALAALLTELETNPHLSTLIRAQEALDRFRRQLSTWLTQERLERPYRVNTWINRLTAMETILRYGQRTLQRGTMQASQ